MPQVSQVILGQSLPLYQLPLGDATVCVCVCACVYVCVYVSMYIPRELDVETCTLALYIRSFSLFCSNVQKS